MNEEQIKYMTDRFLGWLLPENFSPDAGISFKRTFNENTAHAMKHEPRGTNLFDASQAEAMVRYIIKGMPISEFGWLIERGDSSPGAPTYWAGPEQWSQNHLHAVRFSRKQDAERVACQLGQGYHRICEHGWV